MQAAQIAEVHDRGSLGRASEQPSMHSIVRFTDGYGTDDCGRSRWGVMSWPGRS